MLLGWFPLGFNLQRKEDYKGETYFLHAQSHAHTLEGVPSFHLFRWNLLLLSFLSLFRPPS